MDSKFIEYIEPVFESLCLIAKDTLPIEKGENPQPVSNYNDDKHKSNFSMMFLLSEDNGKSFQWFLTKEQRKYVLRELSKKKVQPDVYFDHWIRYKFFASGLVSYIRDTERITEYIKDFAKETVLVGTAYPIDNLYPYNAELLREAEQRRLIIGSDVKNELKKFEKIWGFEKTPFFYFEVFEDDNKLSKEGKAQYKIYGLIPCHKLEEQTQNNRAKYMMNVLELISLSKTYIEASYSLRSKIEKDIDLSKRHAMKSAIAAIMSRNGSHNIGSHVINRVVEAMDSLNIQDHKYFLRYLQQRMDFVAQISTEFSQWTTSHWFVKEIMRGFYEQTHLINYIARSEGLKAYNIDSGGKEDGHIKCIIKNIKKYNCDNGKNSTCSKPKPSSCFGCDETKPITICQVEGNVEECDENLSEDVLISIPGGIVGFHAFYTILENFLRNSAKHCYATHPNKDHDMTITIEVWNYDDNPEQYTVRIWDNYSYVGGLINTPLDDTLNTDRLKNKKVSVYLKEDPQFNCEGIDFKRFTGTISEADDTSTIHFIVDDCDLNSDDRTKLYCRKDVRFVEVAYWNNFCAKVISEAIIKGENVPIQSILQFLSNYYIPSHIMLNSKIIQPLIDLDGSLKKANWGVAEMKIATGYLQGHSIEIIGGASEGSVDNLQLLLKAIPVPDKYNDRDVYRLGYEFNIKKPVDILIISSSKEEILNEEDLKKGAIILTPTFVSNDNEGATSSINRTGEITVIYGESDELVALLKTGNPDNNEAKQKVYRTQIIRAVEKFGKFRLFIVLEEGTPTDIAVKNTIKADLTGFLSKRIALLSKSAFKKEIEKDRKLHPANFNYTNLKSWLCFQWIKHVKERICQIPVREKISLVVDPFSPGGNSPTAQANSKIDEELIQIVVNTLKTIIEQVCNEDSSFVDLKDLKDMIRTSLVKHKNANNPAGAAATEIINGIYGELLEKVEYKRLLTIMKDNIINEIKKVIGKVYGCDATDYYPPTLPRILIDDTTKAEYDQDLVRERYKNNIDKYYNSIINYSSDSKKTDNYIQYKRHKKCEAEDKGLIYCEDLSGGASHFQSLCHLPKDEHNLSFLICNLLENGLLRIGLADERIYEAATKMGKHLDAMKDAGVKIFEKISDLHLGLGNNQIGGDSIDIENGKVVLRQELECHILIIHQGILDKINVDKLDGDSRKEKIDAFINLLREHIPFICITSGRGKPPELPEGTKFLTFSIIETSLLSKPHSKLTLMRQIL